jgi:hypothetical protein
LFFFVVFTFSQVSSFFTLHYLTTRRHFITFVSSAHHSLLKMPMHVRLKRKNQTIFLHVDPADNFFQLKTRVGEIHGLEPEKIQILGPDKVSKREL